MVIVLEKDSKDREAFACKCIALLHQNKFDDVLQLLAKNKEFEKELPFEKCYALYRTRQYQQALETVRTSKERSVRMQQLEAQIVRLIANQER
jgi:hypothetical protein